MPRCSYCGQMNNDTVQHCASCNGVIYSNAPLDKNERRKYGALIAVIIATVVVVVVCLAVSGGVESNDMAVAAPVISEADKFKQDFKRKGWVVAHMAVENASIDPKSVEFEEQGDENVDVEHGTYICFWYMRCENRYGAMIACVGGAEVHYTGGDVNDIHNWKVIRAEIKAK